MILLELKKKKKKCEFLVIKLPKSFTNYLYKLEKKDRQVSPELSAKLPEYSYELHFSNTSQCCE